MDSKPQARKNVSEIPKRELTPSERVSPSYVTETISALKKEDRRFMRAWAKDVFVNLRRAGGEVAAYREDEECAYSILTEITFLVGQLNAFCENLIELHPGIDDCGDGEKQRPRSNSFFSKEPIRVFRTESPQTPK